jgi:toxin CptA
VAALAIVALQLVRGSVWLHHLLVLLVIAYASLTVRGLVRPPVASLLWRSDGGVELSLRDDGPGGGETVLGVMQGARVMGPLIVLTMRWPPRQRAHLWILPDNLDADGRRRLRVRLGVGLASGIASGNADSH